MTSALIVEDEAMVARRLTRFVEYSFSGKVDIKHMTSVPQANDFLKSNDPDLVFLDLNLHGENGFEVLKSFLSKSFHTVVVSAYTDKALEAFEYGVLDFIGKPFLQERVSKAVNRFLLLDDSSKGKRPRLAVQSRGQVDFIDISELLYIKAAGIYSELFLKNGEVKVYDKPLNKLLAKLPDRFIRVHRSYVVDQDLICSIPKVRHNQYELKLTSGVQVPVSREMRKLLLKEFS